MSVSQFSTNTGLRKEVLFDSSYCLTTWEMKISTCHCLQDCFSYVKEFLILHLQMAANCMKFWIHHHVNKSETIQCYGIQTHERRRSTETHFKWEEREEREANTQYPNFRPMRRKARKHTVTQFETHPPKTWQKRGALHCEWKDNKLELWWRVSGNQFHNLTVEYASVYMDQET